MLENILKKLGLCTLSTFLIFSSCKKEDNSPIQNITPPNPKQESKEIYDNVVDITKKTPSILNYDKSTGEINFSESPEISEGSVIYSGITSETPYALLRYVYSTSDEGKTLKTRQAGLEEAVRKGEGEIEGKLHHSDLVSSSKNLQLKNSNGNHEFHLDFKEIIYDQDNDLSTTDDQTILKGSADFDIYYYSHLSVEDKKINIEFESKIEGETNASIESKLNFKFDEEINLWKESFKPISFSVGPIPVVVVPKVELNAYVKGDSKSEISLILQDDFNAEANLYYNSDWAFEKDFNNKFSHEINLESSLSTNISVGPKFIGAFYNIAGPSFETNFYGKLIADISRIPWWALNAGLEGKLGFDVGAITKISDVRDFEKTIFNYRKELANAGEPFKKENTPPIAEFYVSPNKGTISTIFEFDASSSRDVEDGFDVQFRWDWETDGTWDTDYSYKKMQNHQFSKTGYNTVTLEVKDSEGLTDTQMQWISIDKEKEEKELIIQPGPEGKDAYTTLVRWYDCSEDYPRHGNDSILEIFVDQSHSSCTWYEKESLISFENLPQLSDISSAKIEFYGTFGSNFANTTPKFAIKKLEGPWRESTVDWTNQPSGNLIKYFEAEGDNLFKRIDVTSTVKSWNEGEPNYGFSISGAGQGMWGTIYSGDHPDKEKRPKLIIKYNE